MRFFINRSLILSLLSFIMAIQAVGQNATTLPTVLGTEKGRPIGSSISTIISAEGGELAAPDGSISIIVPNGCVAEETEFSIQPITNTVTKQSSSRLSFRFLPEGVTFKKPVRVIFQYNKEDIQNTVDDLLSVSYQKQDRSWEMVPASLNKQAKSITIETMHFSDWIVVGRFYLHTDKTILAPGEQANLEVVGIYKNSAMGAIAPIMPKSQEESGTISFVGDWKKSTGPGQLSAISKTSGSIMTEQRYTAPADVAKGKKAEAWVTVKVKGKVVIPDPSATGGQREFEEFILQEKLTTIAGDYMYGTFNGREIFYTNVGAVSFGAAGIVCQKGKDVISISIDNAGGEGEFSGGNFITEDNKSMASFDYDSAGLHFNYTSNYFIWFPVIREMHSGNVQITKWGAIGHPVEGSYQGTLYRYIPGEGTSRGSYKTGVLQVKFRTRRK